MPVFQEQSGDGNTPLPSSDILGNHQTGPGIFCDDTTDPCAVDVTLEQGVGTQVGNGPAMSSTNTLSFPITFTVGASGCPSTDPTVQVDGSYSVEHFMPSAVDATCSGSKGVVALDTTNDNESIIKDFIAGNTSVVFLDTPSDPSAEAQLVGKSYAWIPIAVSGTSVGFLGAGSEAGVPFPIANYNLTPDMLSGIITSAYEQPKGSPITVKGVQIPGYSDNLIAGMAQLDPPVTCTNLVGCYQKKKKLRYLEVLNELQYDTFDMLNPVGTGVTGPGSLGSFMSNVANGASYQATDWICSAPNLPVSVQVNEITPPAGESNPVTLHVTDTNLASSELTQPPAGSTIWPPYTTPDQPDGPPWVFPTCNGYSTFPAIAGNASYAESQNPSFQAKAIRGFAYQGNNAPVQSNVNYAGFGVMDSSEAAFNGLNQASLQNADGDFVAPTESSIEESAQAETVCPTDDLTCPAGTFEPDYSSAASATAYALPNVTYALVSTLPQPAATATAIKNLLTNLVTYSHNGSGVSGNDVADAPSAQDSGTAVLPAGYAALADVDVHGGPDRHLTGHRVRADHPDDHDDDDHHAGSQRLVRGWKRIDHVARE